MNENLLSAATAKLAGKAVELSSRLHLCEGNFSHHESIVKDISAIAEELSLLSTTLWRLNEAITADPEQYTESFNKDLGEITGELKLIFEEISESTDILEKGKDGSSTVAWIFKKNRINRLLKHLEALKTTLIVMRTVLWHGKEYGTHQ